MSLYRQPGQARRRRRLAILGIGAALLAVAAIVVLATRGDGPPTPAQRVAAARSAAAKALDGLELVQIEYGQAVRGGRVIAPTEYRAAQADVQRARRALADHTADLAAVDPRAPRELQAALARVAATVGARAAEPAVLAVLRAAQQRLDALRRAAARPPG